MNDLEKVKQDWLALQYVKHQTEAICLAAVKQNGYAYVQHQTEAICLAAVKEDYRALQFVHSKYFETAVKTLRFRALFQLELNDYIEQCEKKMQI